MKRTIIFGLVFFFTLGSMALAAEPKVVNVERPDVPSFVGYVPNEIVVQFDPSIAGALNKQTALLHGQTGVLLLDQVGKKHNAVSVLQQFPGAKGRGGNLAGWHKIKYAGNVDVESVVSEYKAIPGVIDAQPIGIHTISAAPNDGWYSNQWHLNQTSDHDIDAPEAWNIENGNENLIVAIMDTGVRYFHKDLGGSLASYSNPTNVDGNMWVNWDEKNGVSGIDDDGNGYVDDWGGWDWVNGVTGGWSGEDCNIEDNDPRDFNGHGTHCAGIVAAITNNGYATSSTAGGWGNGNLQQSANGVKVMALRIGWSGKYNRTEVGYVRMDFAAEAFYYAADNGAKIASCSWGCSNSGGIAAAIDYFLASGGMIFKAAGNDGTQIADYMCSRTDIISVAATDENDCKSSFSTYGTWVDISAPGVNILSLYHLHTDPVNDYVASMSGTSMATPLAASVAALIWSQNPAWTAAQVEQNLYAGADNIESLPCNATYSGKLGAGRINAFNAVGSCDVTPAFSGSPTSGCAPLTVNFNDLSTVAIGTGAVSSWNWDFGDGVSSEQNPSHTYSAAGSYTVSLTAHSPTCSATETKINYITVTGVPVANFVGSPTTGNAPLTVNFTDQSTNSPTSWIWDFGDGGIISTDRNPSHTYTNPSTNPYTVTLTASNSCGDNTEIKTGFITVTVPPPNNPPDAVNDIATTPEDTAVDIYVLGNDTDPDMDPLTVSVVSQGAHGTVVNKSNLVTYTPSANFYGTDSFTYRANDGTVDSNNDATVTINVTAASSWTVLTSDNFEGGFYPGGSYYDGGSDCSLYTGGTYAHQSSKAADIQDNSGTSSSFYYLNGKNVTGYNEIQIDFWFYAVSMETGEDFWVQYYNGSTWQTVATFVSGTGTYFNFNNGALYNKVVTINKGAAYNFPANMKIRFMCDASDDNDDVYIDDIVVRAK